MYKEEVQIGTSKKENIQENIGRTVYCHFSFKRPKGQEYGLFSVAFYNDFEGKKLITHKTRKYDLWQNHQFVTAIQSYEHALKTIHEFQGQMRSANINQIMLVTDNSTLAGWIENPKKNKNYSAFMDRAVKEYRAGAHKEIVLGVGLCEPRDAEKSYKYCKEELVENEYVATVKNTEEQKESKVGYKMNLGEHKSILDILAENKAIPEVVGIKSVE